MKVYYIYYRDSGDKRRVEAFKSKATAQRRVTELKEETKAIRKLWSEFVINKAGNTRPPDYVRELPDSVHCAEFEKTSEGMLEAFTFLSDKEQIWK